MNRLILACVLLAFLIQIQCKEYESHFVRIDKMNDTDEFFKYDLKSVEKINRTAFKVNLESELNVDLDKDWHVSWKLFLVWIHKNKILIVLDKCLLQSGWQGRIWRKANDFLSKNWILWVRQHNVSKTYLETFKGLFKFSRTRFVSCQSCKLMKIFKVIFNLKLWFSQNHYYLKDYIFNGEKYKQFMRPGMGKIDMFTSQDHGDSHVTKIGVSIFIKVTEVSD